MKTFTLNTGAQIPEVGFGTWKAGPGEAAAAVQAALDAGYRHFDCAPLYGNEAEIGKVFASTSIPREELFITTKLWSSDHRRIPSALARSLRDLRLDYVDLYLMHWPITLDPSPNDEFYGQEDRKTHAQGWDFTDTWREMEKLLSTRKVRAIGVANFSTTNLARLLENCTVVPAVNQTELHPFLPQEKLHEFCRRNGIHQTAFGPLGGASSQGTLHEHPIVKEIAETKGIGTGNVLLSWGVQRGWSVIPKSVRRERIAANLSIVVLAEEDMRALNGLAEGRGRFNRPDWGTVIFHDDYDE